MIKEMEYEMAKRLDLGEVLQNELDELFKYFDADGNQQMEPQELKAALIALNLDPSDEYVRKVIEKYSINKKNWLDLNEFKAFVEPIVKSLLMNNDINTN